MRGKLEGKIAIVTGAGRGLGRAIAIALAGQGAKIALFSRTQKELDQTKALIEKANGKAMSIKGDVSKQKDVEALFEKTVAKFGGIDILVNNAGVIGPIGPASSIAPKEWEKNLQINLIGAFMCSHYALGIMIPKRKGKIINISGGGDRPLPNFSAYAAAKCAMIGFNETLGAEVKEYGIDVNAIAPGGINTNMTKQIFQAGSMSGEKEVERTKRILEGAGVPLENAAELAVFLASEESDGITGKLISAAHDEWREFGKRKKELISTDLYTMRRIYPNVWERLRLNEKK